MIDLLGLLLGWGWRLLLVLLTCLVIYGWHPIKRWRFRSLPGPPPTWLFGNLLEIRRLGAPVAFQTWAAEYGPIYKVWQGGNVMVIVEDPVAARSVNMRNHLRSTIFSTFGGKEKEFDSVGIVAADGASKYWQSLKQAWQSMFSAASLRVSAELMNASAERLVNVLAVHAKSGEEIEIWRLFGRLTMDVVGSTAFGLELRTLEHGSSMGVDAHTIVFDEEHDDDATLMLKAAAVLFGVGGAFVRYRALLVLFPDAAPLLRLLATHIPDPELRKLLKARRILRGVCYRLIKEAKQGAEARNGCGGDRAGGAAMAALGGTDGNKGSGATPVGGFIRHLLASDNKLLGRPFTDMEVAAQANTFLLAGYETTSTALAFTVYHIANTPDKEAKLLAEIDAFGRAGVPTYDDMDKFPYLDAVFSESLRLSPPFGFGTTRIAREDCQVCGATIRKGWTLLTAMYSFQNNGNYWEDPEKFVPERYLADEQGAAGMPAWAPFGDGGRSCVGLRFAKAEAKIALIRIFQRFTLRLVDGQVPLEIKMGGTMSPKHGVRLLVHPRQSAAT